MPMHMKGLTKLMEECGELIQACAKKAAFMDFEIHPDGSNMNHRIEEEIADVQAAINLVKANLGLNNDAIAHRAFVKLNRLIRWDQDPNS